MHRITVDETLQRIIKTFYRIGVWQSDEESYSRRFGKKLFYTLFGAFLPSFFAANAWLCADRDESIFSVQLLADTAILYVKLLYVLYKKQEILAFLYDQTVLHSIEKRREYERANRKTKKAMKFVRPYILALFMTAVLIIVSKLPLISADRGLPFFISFTWCDSDILYWLSYLLLSLSALLYVVINSITPVIWYIMLNYCVEYDLLGNKLKRLGVVEQENVKKADRKKNNFRLAQQSMYEKDLIVSIKTHRNLKGTIDRFRSCFSRLFMGQIATSGIGICVSVYNLAYASDKTIFQIEFYVVMLLYGIFDIFLVMSLANDITIASDRLSYCLFESNWIYQTESCKKHVIIMGEVLKQPQQLVVLIYPMNLETFMAIINGAYSMYNILQNLQ